MKRTLTVDIEADVLRKAEERAAQAGIHCSDYVRALIEKDVQNALAPPRRFASEDLVGTFELSGEPATNERVRENLRRQANARHGGDC